MKFSAWRLTENPEEDPHAAAARYVLGGRPKMAESVLKQALDREPERGDLRVHLQRIQISRPSNEPSSSAGLSAAYVLVHALVGWTIFLGSMALLMGAPMPFLGLVFDLEQPHGNTYEGLIWLASILIWGTLACILAFKLFLKLWFFYLSHLPEAHVLGADATFLGGVEIWKLGKTYIRERRLFFAKRYGG